MGKYVNSYNLVDFKVTFDEDQMGSREIHDELKISISEEDLLTAESLNSKQKCAYERILEKVFSNTPAAFFIDGPDGTVKTFLYKAFLATIRSIPTQPIRCRIDINWHLDEPDIPLNRVCIISAPNNPRQGFQ